VPTIDDFQAIDIRVGIVKTTEPFTEGKYSTHILTIDFGPEIGMKKSLAKLKPREFSAASDWEAYVRSPHARRAGRGGECDFASTRESGRRGKLFTLNGSCIAFCGCSFHLRRLKLKSQAAKQFI
jgi:hypothetical protein